MPPEHLWSIGELAGRAGVTVKTVRFYSDRGLPSSPATAPAAPMAAGPPPRARAPRPSPHPTPGAGHTRLTTALA